MFPRHDTIPIPVTTTRRPFCGSWHSGRQHWSDTSNKVASHRCSHHRISTDSSPEALDDPTSTRWSLHLQAMRVTEHGKQARNAHKHGGDRSREGDSRSVYLFRTPCQCTPWGRATHTHTRVDRWSFWSHDSYVPNVLPSHWPHPWALALPRVHERLVFLGGWGRSAIHRERRRAADPPDAAPMREQVRRNRRPLR